MPAGFLRRTRSDEPQLAAPTAADDVLGRLLDRDRIIDRFDADYLDDLPVLLRELHEVTEDNARDHERWDDLRALWTLGGRPEEEFSIAGLANAALAAGVDRRRWTPLQNSEGEKKRQKYTKVRNWSEAGGIKLAEGSRSGDAVETVNKLQSGYSHDVQGGKFELPFDALERPETGDPWSSLIKRLVEQSVPARRRAAPHDRATLGRRDPLLPPGPRPRANDRP